MDASTIVAIEAKREGIPVGNTWSTDWSNITPAEAAAQAATQGAGSGGTASGGGVNWGGIGSAAQQLFSGWRQSKGTGAYSPSPTSYDPPKKDNTGLYIALGVGAIALVGVAVWYFGFKKK